MKLIAIGLLLALGGCATNSLGSCAAYEVQLQAAAKRVADGTLTGEAAAAEKARLEALPERTACFDGIY
jgi:hypothetical protein